MWSAFIIIYDMRGCVSVDSIIDITIGPNDDDDVMKYMMIGTNESISRSDEK